MTGKTRFDTWPAVLAHALDLADEIPTDHEIRDVAFGTFGAGAGADAGSRYVSLSVGYTVGNTGGDIGQGHRQQPRNRRRLMIIEAWEAAAYPPASDEAEVPA